MDQRNTSKSADERVAKHHETSASRLIDILSPVSGALAGSGLPHGIFYRGVSDVSHRLLPAAFRPGTKLFSLPHHPRGIGRTNGEQIQRELETLAAFIDAADRQGHQIPEDSQAMRATMRSLRDNLSFGENFRIPEWPPASLLSALALAQHYGVPTRLLDWSLDPYVSCYFAAAKAAKSPNLDGDLAIWAFTRTMFEVNDILMGDSEKAAQMPIQPVNTPWAGNANAKAQHAVFLAYRQFDISPSDSFEPQPYDELIADNLEVKDGPILYRFTLPNREAPELLRLLAFKGYNAATIFPGLEGAALSIEERYLWPKNSRPDRDPRSCLGREVFLRMIKDFEDREEGDEEPS